MKLFVEQLTVIDSAYLSAEHGLVGESWMVDITLHGALDEQSMVMDFSEVKKKLKAAIDNSIDHTLIVPAQASALTLSDGEQVALSFTFGRGEQLHYRSPKQAVTLLPTTDIDHRAIADWLEPRLLSEVPPSVTRVEVALRTEQENQPYYHYVHGLKKHAGNCQRIAHGHRSRIMIWRGDMRELDLEQQWAKDWNRAYIATVADCTGQNGALSEFRYESAQGEFTLSYPTARCRFIKGDTTVESIAQHIADTLRARDMHNRYRVRAYEGVSKGAIAEAA